MTVWGRTAWGLAADSCSRGFRFLGSAGASALMETTGMAGTRLLGCHRRGAFSSPPVR
ncbi:hypothetical protein [Actinomadura parmotrematis]|uniref:Uncharacterized protein n=1 Tax=Actinomadura parmotrematis TaxID=2864039 RepID=A0ABS7G4P6_9ACTN|nr:hypothetical protein [Actinomadura parmotrematis]MBW8487716.1 hypothetical protein [Actinomadura parmotrematis]